MMNKAKVIEKLSVLSGVERLECEKVLNALEVLLKDEMESSKGVRSALDKICDMLSVLRNK